TWRYSWKADEIWISLAICFYLIVFHLNHFKWGHSFFIALGAVLGMIFLSLIAYGIELLKNGHFFQSGDRAGWIYLLYLVLEICFVSSVLIKTLRSKYFLKRDY